MSNDHDKYFAAYEVDWENLSLAEIDAIADRIKEDELSVKTSTWHIRFAQAVQRKLKEKNTELLS